MEHGPNTLAKDQRPSLLGLVWRALRNPLVILLGVLAVISFATRDARAGTMMLLMIALSLGLKLFQEAKANNAAAKLRAMISVTASVLRGGVAQDLAVPHLVPGDVVQLAAGDMIPADVRLVQAKDHEHSPALTHISDLTKVDEIPFDFDRRIMSVVVRMPDGRDRIVSKGAPEAIPFLQSRPSTLLMLSGLGIIVVGVALPYTAVGHYLGFSPLPLLYWPYIALTLLCYVLLTQTVKAWLLRRRWI